MGKSEKQMDKEHERNQRIIDTALRLFVEKKIEAVSMDEVAKEAGVGRATLFRCYNNKTAGYCGLRIEMEGLSGQAG